MKINLYAYKGERNVVDKTSELSFRGQLTGTLREECNLIYPRILISSEVDIYSFNYIRVSEFQRYYFVDNITVIRENLYMIECSVDVLYTYKEAIYNTNAFVDRNEFLFNEDLVDEEIPCTSTPRVSQYSESFVYERDPDSGRLKYIMNDALGGDCYIMVLTGRYTAYKTYFGDNFMTNTNVVYVCSKYILDACLKQIVEESGNNLFADDLINGVIGVYATPFTYLTKMFDFTELGFVDSKGKYNFNIYLASNSFNVVVDDNLDRIYVLDKVSKSDIYKMTVNFKPITDIPSFMMYKPYTHSFIDLPLYGRLDIEPDYLKYNLSVKYNICISTCSISIFIDSSQYGRVYVLENIPIGVSLSVTGSNATERTRNLLLGGISVAAGIVGAVATGGASLGLIGSGTKQLISPESTTTKINRGKGGQVSSVKTVKTPAEYEETKKLDWGGVINYISKNTISTLSHTVEKINISRASIGDGSTWTNDYLHSVYLYFVYPSYFIPDNYAHLVGRPCQYYGKLGDLQGFTRISAVHLKGFAVLTSEERETLDSQLRLGIYLPTNSKTSVQLGSYEVNVPNGYEGEKLEEVNKVEDSDNIEESDNSKESDDSKEIVQSTQVDSYHEEVMRKLSE